MTIVVFVIVEVVIVVLIRVIVIVVVLVTYDCWEEYECFGVFYGIVV